MTERTISHEYQDPLDLIWLEAARRLGMRVERSREVYASWDGAHTLTLSTASDFDPDDSLAQLIFHEICHALVAGPDGLRQPDWGLDNQSERDLVSEHACHRVQAALAAPYGLRAFFAVTTAHRAYWDALPENPLAASEDPALPAARRALTRAEQPPYRDVLTDALRATADLADLIRPFAPEGSLFRLTRARHPSGFLENRDRTLNCGDCAWFQRAGKRSLCRQAAHAGHPSVLLRSASVACERWEPRLEAESCASCGACCREGFDRVELRRREPLLKKRPDLIRTDNYGTFVPRPHGHCLALTGDGKEAPYRCSVYADRPRSCAEFAVGGAACLVARRRVGLSH